MKTRLSVALMLPAATAASRATADDKAPKGDLAKLQGTWSAKVGPEKNIAIRLIFAEKDVSLSMSMPDGNDFESKGEFSLDDKAQPHKTIDFRKFKTPEGEDLGENRGIYAFEDADTLKVCSGGPGNDRPSEFKAGDDGAHPHLVVLKREKPEADKDKAAAADAPAPKGDLAKFQGKWTTKIGPNGDLTLAVTFKGNAVTATGTAPDGGEFKMQGELKLDDQAKPHKTIDWVKFTGPDGNEHGDNLGIYEIESDDTIKVCNGGPDNPRPTEFKDGDGGHPHVLVLKRIKD